MSYKVCFFHRNVLTLFVGLGVHTSKVLEIGENYLVRAWVEGIRGDTWYRFASITNMSLTVRHRVWKDRGLNVEEKGFQDLLYLWKLVAKKGRYIQSLKV